MSKSSLSGPVFLIAPQGSGKSRLAERLRAELGCSSILDEWDGKSPVPVNALVMSNVTPRAVLLTQKAA